MTLYRIANWDAFEHPTKSKRPQQGMTWFRHTAELTSKGSLRLLRLGHEGYAAMIAFERICALHADRTIDRRTGLLDNSDGTPIELDDLADAIRMPEDVVRSAVALLADARIGWLEVASDQTGTDPGPDLDRTGSEPGPPSDPDGSSMERDGTEREEEGPSGTPSPPAPKGGEGTAPTEAGGDAPADDADPPGGPATRRSTPKPPGKARKKTATAAAKPGALAGTALEGLTPRAVLEAWDAEWLQMVGEPHTWANGRASAALASQLLHRLAPTGLDLGDIRETMRLAIGGTTDFHRNFANFATRFEEVRANARMRARASPGHGRRSAMDTHAADLLGELNDVGRPAARLRVES